MTSIVQLMTSGLITSARMRKAKRSDLFQNVDETEITAITLKTNTEGARSR